MMPKPSVKIAIMMARGQKSAKLQISSTTPIVVSPAMSQPTPYMPKRERKISARSAPLLLLLEEVVKVLTTVTFIELG